VYVHVFLPVINFSFFHHDVDRLISPILRVVRSAAVRVWRVCIRSVAPLLTALRCLGCRNAHGHVFPGGGRCRSRRARNDDNEAGMERRRVQLLAGIQLGQWLPSSGNELRGDPPQSCQLDSRPDERECCVLFFFFFFRRAWAVAAAPGWWQGKAQPWCRRRCMSCSLAGTGMV
jgi:hypothetical protein